MGSKGFLISLHMKGHKLQEKHFSSSFFFASVLWNRILSHHHFRLLSRHTFDLSGHKRGWKMLETTGLKDLTACCNLRYTIYCILHYPLCTVAAWMSNSYQNVCIFCRFSSLLRLVKIDQRSPNQLHLLASLLQCVYSVCICVHVWLMAVEHWFDRPPWLKGWNTTVKR